jgi:hypothetical protein
MLCVQIVTTIGVPTAKFRAFTPAAAAELCFNIQMWDFLQKQWLLVVL